MSFADASESFDVGNDVHILFELDQGDLAIDDNTRIGADLKKKEGKTWVTPLEIGDPVKIGGANMLVTLADPDDNELIGWLVEDPKVGKNTIPIPDRDDGNGPFSGIYLVGDIAVMARRQRTVPRATGGVAPVLGQSLLHGGGASGEYEGKGSLTNTNIVVRFTATEITALWEFQGKLDA
jgi:hypothetical protein